MPVNCDGYVINGGGDGWRRRGGGVAALGAAAMVHAERGAFGQLPASACYLLVQNAFPCATCHAYFMGQSLAGHSVIIKVTANEGAYSADHGFGLRGGVPCVIYYHAGTARYDSITHAMAGTGGAHAAFPAHPSIDAV
ncbi:MAG: hypothetical protein V4582_09130 [Pseudomonadota bacterium]